MFELIPNDSFAEIMHSHLGALDRGYVDVAASHILEELRSTFDVAYQTLFIIVDAETGAPMSTETLKDRRTADDCRRLFGDRASVGILLVEQ